MTGIGDLHAMFNATERTTSRTDGDATAQRTRATGTDGALGAVDSSRVSTTAGSLLSALGESDVRSEKVQQLQASIAGGTYNVSAGDVADKLIAAMLAGRLGQR